MGTDDLMYASDDDIAFFHKCIHGLPNDNGYSIGAHSVRCFREIIDIVKPKTILEIGFNVGKSASIWLTLSGARLVSNDISEKAETIMAAQILHERFVQKFSFLSGDSATILWKFDDVLKGENFDLIFIDGGHLDHHVMADIKLALDLKIKWLAFDDILPQFGPGVLPSIAKHPQLKEVKTMGNIALYENTSV